MAATNFYYVPFRDQQSDGLALMDSIANSNGVYIPRTNCELEIHSENKIAFDRARKSAFSEISDGDRLFVVGHLSDAIEDRIYWIRTEGAVLKFSPEELAKWVAIPLQQNGINCLEIALISGSDGDSQLKESFRHQFETELRKFVKGVTVCTELEQGDAELGEPSKLKEKGWVYVVAHQLLNRVLNGNLVVSKSN